MRTVDYVVVWDHTEKRWYVHDYNAGTAVGYIYSENGILLAYVSLRDVKGATAPLGMVNSITEGVDAIYTIIRMMSEAQYPLRIRS